MIKAQDITIHLFFRLSDIDWRGESIRSIRPYNDSDPKIDYSVQIYRNAHSKDCEYKEYNHISHSTYKRFLEYGYKHLYIDYKTVGCIYFNTF